MPPKLNPLKLNPLQLRTLTVLQALARVAGAAEEGPGPGEVTVVQFPNAHGDHFHLGDATVAGKDMTGLYNEKVWHALGRKGVSITTDVRKSDQVNALVAAQNRDRNALYAEIARANGHPEWQGEIRHTFAQRWIQHARSGWWVQSGGGWTQK